MPSPTGSELARPARRDAQNRRSALAVILVVATHTSLTAGAWDTRRTRTLEPSERRHAYHPGVGFITAKFRVR